MNSLVTYNPFGKNLKELLPNDLSILQNVAEGWYVEYKSQLVPAKNIAKSISAFANHYGGWVFYGIDEALDGSNTAGSFLGLNHNEVVSIIERIRNATKDLINPTPYYEYKIIEGPCPEISLLKDKSVVAVLIPSGPNAPYIHSDGRIYRRIADSSDPKPETDRFILDQLWMRGQKSQAKLGAFLQQEPELSKGEGNTSFLELFLLPDPLGAKGQSSNLKFKQFVDLMSDPTTPGMSMLCDNFYTMADGFIARQVNINNPYNLVYTWKHYLNGFSVISVPFSSSIIEELVPGGWLSGYKYENAFFKLLKTKKGYEDCHLLDVNHLLFFVMSGIHQQRRLMEVGGIQEPLYAKTVFRNIWRRVPFIDTEYYINHISMHGFPVIQFSEEFAPPGKTFDSLVLIPKSNFDEKDIPEDEKLLLNQVNEASHVLGHMLNALGLSTKVILPDDEIDEERGFEWWQVINRLPKVNKNRGNR